MFCIVVHRDATEILWRSGAPNSRIGMAQNANGANLSAVTHKIDDIQILRGVAITMVLIHHLSFSSTLFSAFPVRLTTPFYAGVELFFVISGFVVTRSLIRGNYEPVSFLIRRGFRLYPPILAFLAFGGAVNAIIRVSGRPRYAADYLCVPLSRFIEQAVAVLGGYLINLGGGVSYMNGAMWSLSVEFQFYAAVAILGIAALALRVSPRVTEYAVVACAAMVYVVCSYARIMLTLGAQPSHGMYLLTWKFDYMALGVLLAYVPESVIGRTMRYGRALSVGFLLVPVVILSLCRSPLAAPASGPDYLNGVGMLLTAPCYLALVTLAVGGNVSRALPGAVNRLLFVIGERSYTVYLLHFPVMVVAWILITEIHPAWGQDAWSYAIAQIVFTLLVLIPLTELVYRRIELKAISEGARMVRVWRRWRAKTSPA
jgi:peptidoglycan/LPS O-acetylase OafA/YrhL